MANKTIEFILKAKALHGDIYDYSNVIYINAHEKVVIVCGKHGVFKQSPNGHLVKDKKNGGGRGCIKCGRIRGALKTRKGTYQFIVDAQKIHGNKYDYSNVDYKTSNENVTIICRKDDHGPFQQQPLNHLGGKGCSKCSGVYKPNTDEFIQKAKKIHGENTYDYSLVNYVDCKTPVTIICPKEGHGPFEQAPSNHYNYGCSKCGYKRLSEYKTLTTDEFIQKAKEIHGEDKYDYTNVDYKDSQTKVTIVCNVIGHGQFEQAPNSHIQGAGCAKCSGTYKPTTLEFIQKAKEKHGDIYNYSMVDYTGCKDYVTIICPKEGHGPFQQTPDSHINNKAGCQMCSNQRTALRMSDTQEDFLRKAVEVHGNKFDYSKVHYIDSQTYVTIICQEEGHGEFPQVPSSHLQGTGCIKCSGTYQSNTDEFIQKAREIHRDRYDYSNVDYINCHTSVIITCREHGNFEQAASGHLSGKGCYICGGTAPLTLEIAIKRFQEKHGDKYDYSKCEYVNCSTNMTIICRKHGEFQQTYDNHSRGQGCPSCVWKTEGKLYDTLKTKYPTIQRQFKADWCKNKTYLPFDFYIAELKTIFELDGGQHFIQVSNWSSPEEQLQNDLYKQKCANENGYSVIRLLQEDVLYDTYDWCKKIDDAIEEIKNSDEPKNIYLCENNEYYRYK